MAGFFLVYTLLFLTMSSKLYGWDDTIVALATPPGVGAIGVIRLSGQQALSIADALFPSKNLFLQPSHTLHVGMLATDEQVLDEVVISLYKGPKSYTGENVVEVSCHGSPYIHQQIISACIQKGARLAKAGEFTQRAFLNGKLDLTQAEAVADLIASNSSSSHTTALKNIRGGFSTALKQLRDQLLQFSALIELELDFSQEDVAFADRGALEKLVNDALGHTKQLIESFRLGNAIKNGVSTAIIGKPNAGKSTLLNALLKDDRAIVSEIPGTTRDTIEELINIEGVLFRLIDTAGLRNNTSDVIESAGIEKSIRKMKEADLVLYLFDVNELTGQEVNEIASQIRAEAGSCLLVGNKTDTVEEHYLTEKFSTLEEVIFVSAKSALHLEQLKEKMVSMVLQGNISIENTIVTNARHFHALQQVFGTLADIQEGLNSNIPGDLLALDIRRCLHHLGEITGEITNEDQLDYIFSKFCIGK
jgi:tRNA modification GTPase